MLLILFAFLGSQSLVANAAGEYFGLPPDLILEFADYFFAKSIIMHANSDEHSLTTAFGRQVNDNGYLKYFY